MLWFALCAAGAPFSLGFSLLGWLAYPADYAIDRLSRMYNRTQYTDSEHGDAFTFVRRASPEQLLLLSLLAEKEYRKRRAFPEPLRQSDASSTLWKRLSAGVSPRNLEAIRGDFIRYLKTEAVRNDGKAATLAIVRAVADNDNLFRQQVQSIDLSDEDLQPRSSLPSSREIFERTYARPDSMTSDPVDTFFYYCRYVMPIFAGLVFGFGTGLIAGLVAAVVVYAIFLLYRDTYKAPTLVRDLSRNENKSHYSMDEARRIADELPEVREMRFTILELAIDSCYRSLSSFSGNKAGVELLANLKQETTHQSKIELIQAYLRNQDNDGSRLHYAMIQAWRKTISQHAVYPARVSDQETTSLLSNSAYSG